MLKFQKSWLKNYVITRIPDLFLILFSVLLLSACAARPSLRVPPRTDLADPLRGTKITQTVDYRNAYQSYLEGDQDRARRRYFSITKKTPDYYPAYLGIAYTYLAEDNVEYAEGYIGKALEVNPDYAQARFVLANILEVRQNYAAALEQLEEVARIDPLFPDLGQAQNVIKLKATEEYLEKGRELAGTDPHEALNYLKAAHDMAPEVAQIPLEIATILLQQDNCEEAVGYLRIAAQNSPDDSEIKVRLAECLFNLHEYQQAKNIYEELALQMPDNRSVRETLEEIRKRLFIQNLPMEYQNIPQTGEMSRAQLAAYLVINLEILQKYSSENPQIIVDIIQHWAQSYIQKVVNLGIMDVFPNRTFQPNQPVSKLELAKAASRVMEIIEMNGRQRYPADAGPAVIPDVPPGHMHYGLISKPVAAGILSLDGDGRFHGSRRVSGSEAISVVNRLKALTEPL